MCLWACICLILLLASADLSGKQSEHIHVTDMPFSTVWCCTLLTLCLLIWFSNWSHIFSLPYFAVCTSVAYGRLPQTEAKKKTESNWIEWAIRKGMKGLHILILETECRYWQLISVIRCLGVEVIVVQSWDKSIRWKTTNFIFLKFLHFFSELPTIFGFKEVQLLPGGVSNLSARLGSLYNPIH